MCARQPPSKVIISDNVSEESHRSPVGGFFHLTMYYRFLSETMTAIRTPKAIINDNASYVLMLSPPIRGIGDRPSATSGWIIPQTAAADKAYFYAARPGGFFIFPNVWEFHLTCW